MSNLHNVSINTIYQFIAKAANSLAGLIILSTIARELGVSAVGEYTLILNFLGLFFILIDFGANAIIVKQLINTNSPNNIISKLLTIRLIWASVLSLFASLTIWLMPSLPGGGGYNIQVKYGVSIGVVVLFVMAVLATANALFQAKKNYLYAAIINIIISASQVCLTFVFLKNSTFMLSAITAYVLSGVIGSLTALYIMFKIEGRIKLSIDKTYTKNLLIETLPLSITMLTNLIYFRVDTFILPLYRSLTEVGQYNLAYKVFDNVLSIPTFATNALYPILLEKFGKTGHFKKIFQKSVYAYILLSILITTITYSLAPYITFLLTGGFESNTIKYLRILSLGTTFFFTSSLLTSLVIIKNLQLHLIWIYAINMLATIILNIFLIPRYGAYASAILTIILEAGVCLGVIMVLKFAKAKVIKS